MSSAESIIKLAALKWFGELGYVVKHGPDIAPGEPAAERDLYDDVLLMGRLCEVIRQLNVVIPHVASFIHKVSASVQNTSKKR